MAYFSKANGSSKSSSKKRPFYRVFSFTSTFSRSSGSFRFSRSSLRSTLSRTSNTNPSSLRSKRLNKDSQEPNKLEENNAQAKPVVQMQHLQKPERLSHRRAAMNRRRCDMRGCNVSIPTTINEESSRISKTPPTIVENPIVRAIIEKEVSESDLCSCSMCQCQCSEHQCSCEAGREVSYDDSCQDSNDGFCETCADAGLVECCHIPPEPKIRLALLKTIQVEKETNNDSDRRSDIPVITFNQYH